MSKYINIYAKKGWKPHELSHPIPLIEWLPEKCEQYLLYCYLRETAKKLNLYFVVRDPLPDYHLIFH